MPRAPKLEYPPLMLYMIFPAHAWFSTRKINVKLAYTYRGRTKIYFLKWGRRTKEFEKPCSMQQLLSKYQYSANNSILHKVFCKLKQKTTNQSEDTLQK